MVIVVEMMVVEMMMVVTSMRRMLSMNVMILSLSSTLSQAKGAVYAYEVVYQGAWA